MQSPAALGLLSKKRIVRRGVALDDTAAAGSQDEHILARKYADRWMYKSLGVGLFGREVFRREIKDPRKKFYDAVLLANLQARGKSSPAKVSIVLPAGCTSGPQCTNARVLAEFHFC